MADYLQRLINRAQGTADKHPVVLPPMRGPLIKDSGIIEDPFNKISPMAPPEASIPTTLPASSETAAKEPHIQFQERDPHKPLSTNSFSRPVKASVNDSITDPVDQGQAKSLSNIQIDVKLPEKQKTTASASAVAHQTATESISSGRQATKDRLGIQSPLPGMQTGTSKPVLFKGEKASQPTRSANEHRSSLQEGPISPLYAPSKGVPKAGMVEKSEIQAATLHQNAAPIRTMASPSLTSKRSGATTRSFENNTNALRPRENAAVSNPFPSRQQPRLVIGRLQVDVIQTPAEAPPLQPVRETPRPARRQQKRFKRLPSKLRFGLGQL